MRSVAMFRWTAIGITMVLLTLAYIEPFGSRNQATYLLDPLHRAMPELFARDWFVSETPTYMPVFGWLAHWLFVLDPDGPLAVMFAHVVVSLASYAALAAIAWALAPGWRASVIVMCFATVTRELSMGGTYLFVGYLQPSSLATLGWLVALAALVHRRYMTCGIALAIAGAVHANFLVLGVGLFALAALAVRQPRCFAITRLLAPQLLVLACFLPTLLGAAGPSDEAIWILGDFHSPVHYGAHRLVRWILQLVAWQVAAYAALRVLGGDPRAARVLWWFGLVALVIASASALVVQVPEFRSLVQLFCARVAPFSQLACQVVIVAALVHGKPASLATRITFGASVAVALFVTWQFSRLMLSPLAMGIAAGLAVLAIALRRREVTAAMAVLALAWALVAGPRGTGLTTTPDGTAGERELETWARQRTAEGALFLIPPQLGRFRLLARRAVVVDAKSPPLRPDLLVAWYRRLCASVDVLRAPTVSAVIARYASLAPHELAAIALRFEADFVVVAPAAPWPGTAPVFDNGAFAVYPVR